MNRDAQLRTMVIMDKRFFLLKRWAVGLLITLAALISQQCTFPVAQDASSGNGDVWPHIQSDQKPDPSVIFGRYPNGFRYMLKENRTPRDRVSMHLFVQAGSLNEADDEQGLAHFLEHMLFNGSTHFAPGEMVKYFQRIGMQFGPDANAHTGFDQTVYDVILPTGDPKSVQEGLLVLQDYAQGALLLADETERERKVILAEMRTRDSADFRLFRESFQFEMPGGLIPQRFPIGRKEVIEKVDAEGLRRFYDTWYRPERMVLLMAGDFDTSKVLPLIKEAFGDLSARQPPGEAPSLGYFTHSGIKSFHRYEKDTGATSIHIETIQQISPPRDTQAWRQRQLMQDLADAIVQQRLDALLQNPETLFNDADISSGVYLQHVRYAEISADCKPQDWRSALASMEQELRQALQYGFTQAEVDRVKKAYLADLSRDVDESNTRDSVVLARDMMRSLGNWEVFQSPQQRLALFAPLVEKVTAAELHHAFKASWSAAHRLVLVTGNADLAAEGGVPEHLILEAYRQSNATPVSPPSQKNVLRFPYLPAPEKSGVIETRNHLSDLGITRVAFANNVQLLIKPTPFKENQVLMALSFGYGKASEPADQPGLAQLSEAVINASGFGQMDAVELENALAGYVSRIALDVREDRFVVRGETLSSELSLMFQLLYTFVQDPGFRSEALHRTLKRFEQMDRSLSHTVEGALQLQGQRFLAGGDSRFGFAGIELFRQLSLEDIQQWVGGPLARAPLELAVVGDVDPQAIIELAGRYFGSLPRREDEHTVAKRTGPEFPTGNHLDLKVESRIPKSMVVVAYPTEDFWDIARTRRLSIMGEVFSERLRERIREKMGAAYSPFAYNRPYRAYPGYGLFQVYLSLDPDKAQFMVSEVYQISNELIQNGISQDEFQRALDPTLTGIKDLRQTNNYWLNSVLAGASRHPQQLKWARTIESDYAAIRADEVEGLMRTYLDNRKAAVIIVTPEAPNEASN